MRRILTGLLLWAIMVSAALASINERCPQFTAHGAPTYSAPANDQQLCRKNYAVIHSCAARGPIAVMEYITPKNIASIVQRQDDFREDPEVHAECRATLTDYNGAGYDRGHMSAAGNNTQSADIMSESFLLSNMVPQVANNNRGIWRALETQVRNQVRTTGQGLYVISGGVFDAEHKKIGRGVAVPTRLFKIIINPQIKKLTAFLLPNTNLPVTDLSKYMTTVEEVEQATGLKFAR